MKNKSFLGLSALILFSVSSLWAAPPAVIKVASGYSHSCALFDSGKVKCWGYGSGGYLGLGGTQSKGSSAADMGDNLPYVDFGKDLAATDIQVSQYASCVLFSNKKMKCWGSVNNGSPGYGDSNIRGTTPQSMGDNLPFIDLGTGVEVKSFAMGMYGHLCAVLTDGGLKCWGYNPYGQLGLGDVANRGLTKASMGDGLKKVDLGPDEKVKTVAVGYQHTCALLESGKVKCWGDNTYGQLGSGNTNTNIGSTASQMGSALKAVDFGDKKVSKLVSSGWNNCVIFEDMSAKCWGYGGTGTNANGSSTDVGKSAGEMGSNLKAANLGTNYLVTEIFSGQLNFCAQTINREVKCWGYNPYGQLGLGDSVDRGTDAMQLGDNLPFSYFGQKAIPTQISLGYYNACGVFKGRVKCWGYNGYGQLGLGHNRDMRTMADLGDNLPFVDLGTK